MYYMKRFLLLLALLTLLPVAAQAQDISGADKVTDSQGFGRVDALFDGKTTQGHKTRRGSGICTSFLTQNIQALPLPAKAERKGKRGKHSFSTRWWT